MSDQENIFQIQRKADTGGPYAWRYVIAKDAGSGCGFSIGNIYRKTGSPLSQEQIQKLKRICREFGYNLRRVEP